VFDSCANNSSIWSKVYEHQLYLYINRFTRYEHHFWHIKKPKVIWQVNHIKYKCCLPKPNIVSYQNSNLNCYSTRINISIHKYSTISQINISTINMLQWVSSCYQSELLETLTMCIIGDMMQPRKLASCIRERFSDMMQPRKLASCIRERFSNIRISVSIDIQIQNCSASTTWERERDVATT
jgi:hypothetical protein